MSLYTNVFTTLAAIILMFLFCAWCCSKLGKSSTTNTAVIVGVPNATTGTQEPLPYPVNQNMMPMPQTMPYGVHNVPVGMAPMGFQAPYPPPNMGPSPYPPNNMGPAPYPQAMPGCPPMSNFGSPYANNEAQRNPPSYDEATGAYARQPAFNPNFKPNTS